MSQPKSFTKLDNLAANGVTAAIALDLANVAEVAVYVGTAATWGSGTAILEQSFDGGTTWFTVPNASWTAGVANQYLGRASLIGGGKVRISLSGATSPSLDFAVKVEQVQARNVVSYTFAANGSSAAFPIGEGIPSYPVTTVTTPAGIVTWAAQGTWGAGTLVLQVSPDGGTTWYNQQAGITANGIQYAAGVTDLLGRFTLSGATAPSLTVFAVI